MVVRIESDERPPELEIGRGRGDPQTLRHPGPVDDVDVGLGEGREGRLPLGRLAAEEIGAEVRARGQVGDEGDDDSRGARQARPLSRA